MKKLTDTLNKINKALSEITSELERLNQSKVTPTPKVEGVNPDNIECGQQYRHVDYPHAGYLGVRLHNGNRSLIVIRDSQCGGNVGVEVVPYSSDSPFWHGFRKL